MGTGSLSNEIFQCILERIEKMLTGGEQICSAGPRRAWAWRHHGGSWGWGKARLKSRGEDISLHELGPPPPRIPADRHLSCSCGPDWRNWPGGAPNLETPCGRGWGIAVLKTRGWVWNLHSIQMNQVHSPPRQAIRRCFSGETQGLRAKPSTSRSLGGPCERVGSPPTLPKMKFASRWAPPLGLPHWSSNELFRASPLI